MSLEAFYVWKVFEGIPRTSMPSVLSFVNKALLLRLGTYVLQFPSLYESSLEFTNARRWNRSHSSQEIMAARCSASHTSWRASTAQLWYPPLCLSYFRLESFTVLSTIFSLPSLPQLLLSSSHICIIPDSFTKLLFFSNTSSCSLYMSEPRLIHH